MSARTDALVSWAETGKMLHVHHLRCVRLSPGGACINAFSSRWFDDCLQDAAFRHSQLDDFLRTGSSSGK